MKPASSLKVGDMFVNFMRLNEPVPIYITIEQINLLEVEASEMISISTHS